MRHVPAVSIVAKIRAEMAKVPMGAIVRNRLYRFASYRDVDVAEIAALAPDGSERWSLSIVGGMRPRIELTMWHGVDTPALAFSNYELAAIDRANTAMGGLLAFGLRANGDRISATLVAALEDRAERFQAKMQGVA